MFRPFLLCFLVALGATIPAKLCLDGCICEYDETNPVIHCENGERTTLQLPTQPMDLFEIIAIPCNDVRYLPSAQLLKAAFPDLKAIDVEGNPNFDCSQLAALEEHFVLTNDCGKEKKAVCTAQNPDCDWKCTTLQKIKDLWKKFKETMQKKAKDWEVEETMQKMQDWFSDAFSKVAKQFS